MRVRRHAALVWVAALVGALVGLAACSSDGGSGVNRGGSPSGQSATPSELVNKAAGPYQGFGIDPPQPRPTFRLTDTAGRPFDFSPATSGRPTLLFFGYTHCPDACPTTMADINQALQAVAAPVRAKTVVVFVTTDVKRDTGPVITKWLAQFSTGLSAGQMIGLHGTQTQIDAAQAAARVSIAEDRGETHSTVVMLYGPDDYAHVSFALSDNEREQMIHDLPIVAGVGG
ncbi:MAG: SCO family protein [Actinomycetota bacterium]|nr:SCO family protein [Actinomycetota bacterium]